MLLKKKNNGVLENKEAMKRGALGMFGPAQIAFVNTLRENTEFDESHIQELREKFADKFYGDTFIA